MSIIAQKCIDAYYIKHKQEDNKKSEEETSKL